MAQTESCLFPYALLEYPKVRRMISELGEVAEVDFIKVFLMIKKGNGLYPLDSIMMLAIGNKRRTSRLRKMLRNYGLYIIEHDMVRHRKELLSWIRNRKSARKVERELTALDAKQKETGLFPNDEFKESDEKKKGELERELESLSPSPSPEEGGE